jgi:hypothetical protein
MTKTPQILTAGLSRRCVLRTAACAAGTLPIFGAAFAPTSVRAQVKMPKSAVAYQDHPKGDRECSNCSLFQPPNACKNVAGDISPKGWCSIWVKK